MDRLGRVQKKGGCPGAGQRCGDLVADVTGLAHARYHHTPATVDQAAAGGGKRPVEAVDEGTWPELQGIQASIVSEEPVAVATIVAGDSLQDDGAVTDRARKMSNLIE